MGIGQATAPNPPTTTPICVHRKRNPALHGPAPHACLPEMGHAIQEHAEGRRPAPLHQQSRPARPAPATHPAAADRQPRRHVAARPRGRRTRPLYAQPLTHIARLTTDDVLQDNGEVLVRLGDPPSPVPEPLAGMLLTHLDQRPNTMTATSPEARWLFPGRRAGQPMTSNALELRLRHLGFPTQRGRTSAIRQLVLQAPAPVVTRMLGYHDTTAKLAAEVGGTWRHCPR